MHEHERLRLANKWIASQSQAIETLNRSALRQKSPSIGLALRTSFAGL